MIMDLAMMGGGMNEAMMGGGGGGDEAAVMTNGKSIDISSGNDAIFTIRKMRHKYPSNRAIPINNKTISILHLLIKQ